MELKSFLAGAAAGIALTISAVVFFSREQSQLLPANTSPKANPTNSAQVDADVDMPTQSPTDKLENAASRKIPARKSASELDSDEMTDSVHVDPLQVEQTGRVSMSRPVTDSHKQLLGENRRADKNSGNPGDVHSALEQEPKDYDWSYFMEQSLGQFLGSHPEIANFDIAGIECRTTICEIQAFGVDQNAGPRWGIIMLDLRNQPWSDFAQTGTSSSTIEGRLVIVTHLHRLSEQQ